MADRYVPFKKTPAPEQRQHYYMVAGTVIFRTEEGETQEIRNVTLNTLVLTETQRFALIHLERAQQGLQMNLQRKIPEMKYEVIDVVIVGMMYLGSFTPTEFNARPDNLKVRERVKEAIGPVSPVTVGNA